MDRPLSLPASKPCLYCDEPATLLCSSCKNTPFSSTAKSNSHPFEQTYYCNAACQKAHWRTHKPVCKALQQRRHLFRAGALLQRIFYLYRERTFDKPIARLERITTRDRKLLRIHDRDCRADADFADPITQWGVMVPFPAEMCKSEEERMALLVHSACTEAVAWMHELVTTMLKGVTKTIEEKTVALDPASHLVYALGVNVLGQEDAPEAHDLLRVELKSGETYALDLASAQFGYFAPVVQWDEYVMQRVSYFLVVKGRMKHQYFGSLRDHYKKLLRGGQTERWDACLSLNDFLAEGLAEGVREWEKVGGVRVRDVLDLAVGLEEFGEREEEVLRSVDRCIGKRLAQMERQDAAFMKELSDAQTKG